MRNLNPTTTLRNAPKGRLDDPRALVLTPAQAEQASHKVPLSPAMQEHYWEFRRRGSFWISIFDEQVSPGVAGAQWLGVKPRRAQQILEELETAGGPRSWFRREVAEGLHTRGFLSGLVVEPSPEAAAFFALLVDNPIGVRIRAIGGESRIGLSQAFANLGNDPLECYFLAFDLTCHLKPAPPKRGRRR